MPNADQIRGIAEKYVAALNESDPIALAEIYADDATLEDPVGGGTVHVGFDAISGFYETLRPLTMEATLIEVRVCGNELLFNFDLVTHFDADSKATINVWDLMVVNDDGRVSSMKAYWGPENMS